VKRIIKKFEEKNIHINNFSVFNLIKDVNILFLDKIGSITKQEMEVKKIYINNDIISTEDPYVKEITFDRIVDISLICNNANYNVQGDSTGALDEIAFLKYAARKKIYKSSVDSRNKKIIDIPCDSDKRFSTVVTKINRGCRANSRGNVEEILNICTHFMVNGIERELTDAVRNEIKKIDMNLSIEGLITEGFAYRNFNYEPSKSENIESNMVFVGIIGLENPLEDNLNNIISKIRDKSLLPIIFTEENKLSAISNMGKAGLIKSKDQVVAGIELDSLNQSELKELLCRARVFCRVTPEIKSKIISLFIKDGHKVASTGEVLGDLPALNLSNVGISKGKASNIVKKISDVYVERNYLDGFFKIRNFSKMLDKNIDRIFKIYFMTLLSEILVLFINSIIGQTGSLDIWGAVSINGLLFIPLSLIILLTKGKEVSMNAMLLRSVLLAGITCIISYGSDGKEASIISLLVLAFGTIIFTMFNSRVSIKKRSNELFMSIISMVIIFLAVAMMLYVNDIIIRNIVAVELMFSGVFLLIFEILCGKWQDSLMR
ncbi:MAG: cation-transporting P-type ATPase, partial [Clostridium sp.]